MNPDNGDNGDASLVIVNTKTRASQLLHYCFTLNNYLPTDIPLLETWLYERCVSFAFQEEIGKETHTPHLQGVISLKKRSRLDEIKYPRIHWEYPVKNVAAAYIYCTKEDTRKPNTSPYLFNYTVPKPLKLIENFYEWQTNIINLIKKEPDDRTIYWYWEPNGCAGKTALAKYICTKFNAICVSGKSNDCKFAIVAYKKIKGIYPDIIIYNVPRCNHDYISYEGMESIKDGFFFSGKYESCQAIFNSPHILVFANDEPDYDKVSKDRWHVVELGAISSAQHETVAQF